MTQCDLANAPAVHLDIEPFAVTCAPQLDRSPLAVPGICFNPACARAFSPARAWQVYCCESCRRFGEQEMRKVGHMAAPALLAWRLGKYETQDAARRDLSRAARRWVGHLQSAWLRDRHRRAAG